MDYTINVDVALPKIRATNVLQLFKSLSLEIKSLTGADTDTVLDYFVENEAERTSAVGHGVSIPHIQSDIFSRRFVLIASLERPIHFDSPDSKPVDLIAILLSPEKDGPIHLRGLSRLTRLLKNEELCDVLRSTKDSEAMKALFINPDGWLMAA